MAGHLQNSLSDIFVTVSLREKHHSHEHIKCFVCKQIPLLCLQAQCCRCVVCGFCFDIIKKTKHQCPMCHVEKFVCFEDLLSTKYVKRIVVECQHQHKGCPWEGTADMYIKHLYFDCNFHKTVCKQCWKHVLRKKMWKHLKTIVCSQHARNVKHCSTTPL